MTGVSVVIPTFNRRALLPRAIASVRRQAGVAATVAVVDDGSTDGTADMMAREYPEIAFARQENRGASAARNRAMRMAKEKFIAFLDSDDEWEAGSLAARVSVLEARPDVDVVFSDFRDVLDGVPAGQSFFETRTVWGKVGAEDISSEAALVPKFFEGQLVEPLALTSTVVLRRSIVDGGELFDEQLRHSEDWEYWLRLSVRHRLAMVRRVLCHRHVQGDNLMLKPEVREVHVRIGRKILATLDLTARQRAFVRRRLAEDLFEWGYHLLDRDGDIPVARRALAEAFCLTPSWRTAKCLVIAAVPRLAAARRLRREVA